MENENYSAYDLEREDPRDPGVSEIPQTPHVKKSSEDPDTSDNSQDPAPAHQQGTDDPKAGTETGGADSDGARGEIDSMIAEMGAEKVLEIIRGNRNAAISQIMEEMKEEAHTTLQSGLSNEVSCHSIFDLANLA